MGIRINLGAAPPPKFDVLMVLGHQGLAAEPEHRPSDPGRDTSLRRLRELFFAHRYTGGLAVVPDGTPTNSGDADRAAYTERPTADAAFNVEFQGEMPESEREDVDTSRA